MIQVVFVDANGKVYNQVGMLAVPRVGDFMDMRFQDVTPTSVTQAHISGIVRSVVWKNQYAVQVVVGV